MPSEDCSNDERTGALLLILWACRSACPCRRRGRARGGCAGRRQASARTRSARGRAECGIQDGPARGYGDRGGVAELRRHRDRHADPFRQHGRADEELSRSMWRAMGRGSAGRQGGQRLHLDRQPARGPGKHDSGDAHRTASSGDGRGRSALQLQGAAADGCDNRWHALWRLDTGR